MDNTSAIIVLPEIEDLLYPLKAEELANLEASVRQYGIRDPLCIWRRGEEQILIDGHHRYALSQKYGIPYKSEFMEFPDLEAVKDWVDRNQIGRRNITDEERMMTLGRIYQRMRAYRSHARAESGEADSSPSKGRTAEQVAQEWNVGTTSVKRASAFADVIEQMREQGEDGRIAAQRILNGEIKDAATALPKISRNPEQIPEIVKGLAAGAARIKDTVKTEPREEGSADRSGRAGDEDSPENFLAGAGMPAMQEPPESAPLTGAGAFFEELEQKAAYHHQPELSDIAKQSSMLEAVSALRPLTALDPAQTARAMPKYVADQIHPHLPGVVDWLTRYMESLRTEDAA